MLTYEDCVGLSALTDEEVSAIAEHEHVPRMIAAEFGNYLIQTPDGVPAIRRIVLDDIANAETRDDGDRALKLRLVLWHFLDTHPDNPKNRTR
jgi:hypothetical protein